MEFLAAFNAGDLHGLPARCLDARPGDRLARWAHLADQTLDSVDAAQRAQRKAAAGAGAAAEDLFHAMVHPDPADADPAAWFHRLVARASSEVPADALHQIHKDLHRSWYRGLTPADAAALSRVLQAHAVLDPHIGYCQGMNFLAATLLFGANAPEHVALRILVAMLRMFAVEFYSPNLLGVQTDVKTANALLHEHLPALGQHFTRIGMDDVAWITTSQIQCLFVHKLPLPTLLALWDIVFEIGSRALFGAVLAFFSIHESLLNKGDMGDCMDVCRMCSDGLAQDCDGPRFLEETLRLAWRIDPARVATLRTDFRDEFLAEAQMRSVRLRAYESEVARTELDTMGVWNDLRTAVRGSLDELERAHASCYPSTTAVRRRAAAQGREAVLQCESQIIKSARRLERQKKTGLSFGDKPWEALEGILSDRRAADEAAAAAAAAGSGGSGAAAAATAAAAAAAAVGSFFARRLSALSLAGGASLGESKSKTGKGSSPTETRVRSVQSEDALLRALFLRVDSALREATTDGQSAPPAAVIQAVASFSESLSHALIAGPMASFADPLCRKMHLQVGVSLGALSGGGEVGGGGAGGGGGSGNGGADDPTGCRQYVAGLLEISKLEQETSRLGIFARLPTPEGRHLMRSTLGSLKTQLSNWLRESLTVRQYRWFDAEFRRTLAEWSDRDLLGEGVQTVQSSQEAYTAFRRVRCVLLQICAHVQGVVGIRMATLVSVVEQIEAATYREGQREERTRRTIDACLKVVARADANVREAREAVAAQSRDAATAPAIGAATVIQPGNMMAPTVTAPVGGDGGAAAVPTAQPVAPSAPVVRAPVMSAGHSKVIQQLRASMAELGRAKFAAAALGHGDWSAKLVPLVERAEKGVGDMLAVLRW